jgi:hypothetical protein
MVLLRARYGAAAEVGDRDVGKVYPSHANGLVWRSLLLLLIARQHGAGCL